ncbi:MAG: glycosyltransferase [Kiritimatiellia bacterium]
MMNPRLSIILPAYNCEKWLPRCLDSLSSQTFSAFEVLCVDDASTDRTLELFQQLAERDVRFVVFHQTANAGVSAARNLALANARGEYCMFCDADDWYEPSMCEKLFNEAERTGADLVQCHCFFEFEEGHEGETSYTRISNNAANPRGKEKSGALLLSSHHKLRKSINSLLWEKIFRLELIRKNAITFSQMKEHEDDFFVLQYKMVARTAKIFPVPLYHYFIRRGSSSDLYSDNHSYIEIAIRLLTWSQQYCPQARQQVLSDVYSCLKEAFSVLKAEERTEACAQINAALQRPRTCAFFHLDELPLCVSTSTPIVFLLVQQLWCRLQCLLSPHKKSRQRRLRTVTGLLTLRRDASVMREIQNVTP